MERIKISHRFVKNRLLYSLKSKLILSFLAISIIPLTAVVTLAYLQFQEALCSQASNQLIVMRDLKVEQVQNYLHRIEQDIKLVAGLPYVKTAIEQLEIGVGGQGLNQVRHMGFLGRPDLFYLEAYHPYAVYHAKYHAFFRELVQTKGYADIWLVSPKGDIIYTVEKRNDFATNLLKGPYQNTLPTRLFQSLIANAGNGQVQMTDFGSYPPAGDIPVSIIGAPILDEDKIVGYLFYQLSLDQINNLMQVHPGFWKTGETYLVGADRLARTKTHFSKKTHFFEQKVDSLAVKKGLMGERGVAIIEDYRGVPVLSAYQPLAVNGFKWVLLAEVDKSEAFGPSNRLRNLMVSIVLVTTLLVIGVGFYIGRSIAKPIVELAETSTRIAAGDLKLRARSGARDEIGHLADAFNSMTARLSELIGNLEQQIAVREQAEQALRDSENRYRGLFENSPISLWEEDFSQSKEYFDGLRKSGITDFRAYFENNAEAVAHCAKLVQVMDINKATLDLFGAKDKDELLSGLTNNSTEDLLSVFREELIILAEGGLRFEGEAVQRSLTGGEKHVALQLSVAPGYEDSLGKVMVSLLDITDRKLAEEKLRTSEERLRMTLEATQIGIWDWDVANDRYYASPTYYTMLGYEPKEGPADRSEWAQRLHPDDKKIVLGKVESVLSRTSEEYSYEARFRHADGPYKWQWAFGYGAGYDQNGKITRMLGLRIDIDKRKRMEEELSAYREHLEELVRERTAEMEAANKELEAFAYSVSHDLRAPLRHIDSFLELLEKKAAAVLDEQSRHYMDTISDAANKMGLLIDDLLSFSRMGRQAMSFQQVELGSLVRDIIRELEPDADGRGIDWCIGELPLVSGDVSMLRMVLTNLIGNALKFTRPRQEAHIEIGSQSGRPGEIVIFVRDNGVGFDMTYVDRLFGVFQRLHHADEFEGTGIGLASVRRIITRHGGRTWAEGELDRGAAFYFSLPQAHG
jgi:PAS domain S-box-containing protein